MAVAVAVAFPIAVLPTAFPAVSVGGRGPGAPVVTGAAAMALSRQGTRPGRGPGSRALPVPVSVPHAISISIAIAVAVSMTVAVAVAVSMTVAFAFAVPISISFSVPIPLAVAKLFLLSPPLRHLSPGALVCPKPLELCSGIRKPRFFPFYFGLMSGLVSLTEKYFPNLSPIKTNYDESKLLF